MSLNLIVAYDKKNNGIGKDNGIPWRISEDLRHFKEITNESVVIMGRKTWDSLPDSYKPLPNRTNVVITRNTDFYRKVFMKNIIVLHSLDEAIECYVNNLNENKKVFIIGGEQLYKETLENHGDKVQRIYTTEVYSMPKDTEYSAIFPVDLLEKFTMYEVSEVKHENDNYFRYINYCKHGLEKLWVNKEEQAYLDVLEMLYELPNFRDNRTEVRTKSSFGHMWKYDLRDTFPLLTTRRQFVRGIFEELMFYLSGSTDNTVLTDKNIHIWDGNTSRKFLDNRGLQHYPDGDMGETYGFNFRHFGANYANCKHSYKGKGYDQLENVIHLIKHNPTSRRMIITLWNPATLHKATLPSCLYLYQFHVNLEEKRLNLMINLRSSDYYLANNWNVCTGSFLVHMICNLEGIDLSPGELTIVTGDTHIYENHMEAIGRTLTRTPRPFPKLVVKKKYKYITDFKYEDMKIVGYHPYPNISVDMVV